MPFSFTIRVSVCVLSNIKLRWLQHNTEGILNKVCVFTEREEHKLQLKVNSECQVFCPASQNRKRLSDFIT